MNESTVDGSGIRRLGEGESLFAERDASYQYRSVSRLAVLSFLLGIASSLTLAHIMMWLVPVAAIAVGIASLRSLQQREATHTGTWFARTGICLALFFGAWAPVKSYVTNRIIAAEARQYVEMCLELVRDGDFRAVHQQTLAPGERLFGRERLREFYQNNPDAERQYDEFAASEPLATARLLGSGLQWRFAGRPGQAQEQATRYVAFPLVASGDLNGSRWEELTDFSVQRTRRTTGNEWRIVRWSLPNQD